MAYCFPEAGEFVRGGLTEKQQEGRRLLMKQELGPKDKAIRKETNRLSRVFADIDDDHKAVAKQLIQNAAFVSVTLKDLQDLINTNGAVEEYDNGGGQTGTRISPAMQSYTKLIANYNAVIKQLISLLPADKKQAAKLSTDPMAQFLNS